MPAQTDPIVEEVRYAGAKLCRQVGRLPAKTLKEKVANLQEYGGVGLEVSGRGLPGRVKDIKDALKGTKIKVSAVCAGYSGCIGDPKVEIPKSFRFLEKQWAEATV